MEEKMKATEQNRIDYGYVIQIDESHFIVQADPNVYGSGYGVCPKEEDPWCKYDIADVQAYMQAHPDKVLADYAVKPDWLNKETNSQKAELSELEHWFSDVYDAQVKQYARCMRLGLPYDNKYGTIEELDEQAEQNAKRIAELREKTDKE